MKNKLLILFFLAMLPPFGTNAMDRLKYRRSIKTGAGGAFYPPALPMPVNNLRDMNQEVSPGGTFYMK